MSGPHGKIHSFSPKKDRLILTVYHLMREKQGINDRINSARARIMRGLTPQSLDVREVFQCFVRRVSSCPSIWRM